jgi:hypothetical protein
MDGLDWLESWTGSATGLFSGGAAGVVTGAGAGAS